MARTLFNADTKALRKRTLIGIIGTSSMGSSKSRMRQRLDLNSRLFTIHLHFKDSISLSLSRRVYQVLISMGDSTNATTVSPLPLAKLLFEEASQSFPSSLSQGNYSEFVTVRKSLTDLTTVSTNVLLIWDIVVTYDQEIESIWWLVYPSVID